MLPEAVFPGNSLDRRLKNPGKTTLGNNSGTPPIFQQIEKKNHYLAAIALKYCEMQGECGCVTEAIYFISAASAIGPDRFNKLHAGDRLGLGNSVLVNFPLWKHLAETQFYDASPNKTDPAIKKYDADPKNWIPGDFAYFTNKSDYLRLAPDGFWMGENTIYIGGGKFSGLGLWDATYKQVQEKLKKEYMDAAKAVNKDNKITDNDVFLQRLKRPKTGLPE